MARIKDRIDEAPRDLQKWAVSKPYVDPNRLAHLERVAAMMEYEWSDIRRLAKDQRKRICKAADQIPEGTP
jgi:hypothetical protein